MSCMKTSSSVSFVKAGECLYRNPTSGTYFARVKVRGKEIKRSLETTNLLEARRKLKDFRISAERLDPAANPITLFKLTEKFEKTFAHLARDTCENKSRVLKKIREHWPNGAKRPLNKIKPSEVREFLALSSGIPSYNLAMEVTRSLFRLAVDDGMIARSPAEGLTYRKREKPIRNTPTPQEFQSLVAAIRNQKYSDTADESADYIEFLGLSGLGLAEASALCWRDIDFRLGHILTFRHKTRTGFSIPIFPQLRPLLEKRLQLAKELNGGLPPSPETKIFSVADPKKSLASACRALGLQNYSSRAFRRMFITTAIERGVDVKVIALWQGHVDGGKLILDTYSHVRPAHSLRMAELMV